MTPRFSADSVLFDLDGTLWDAGEGTAEAYNETAGLDGPFAPLSLRPKICTA